MKETGDYITAEAVASSSSGHFDTKDDREEQGPDEKIDVLASTLEEEYETISLASDCQQADVSIKKQVANIEALIAGHELEDAVSKLEQAERDMEMQQSKMEEFEADLKVKEETVSKLKLERDLADAERRMIKQQLAVLVDVKGSLDLGNAAQFFPNGHEDSDVVCPNVLESNLFTCLQNQEDLHRIVLQRLHQEKSTHRKVSSVLDPKTCTSKSKCWYSLLHRSRKNLSKAKNNLLKFSLKKRWKRKKKWYQSIQDCYQEEILTMENSNDDDSDSWLINEIKSFDVRSREYFCNVQHLMRAQGNRISLLQREVERLMSMQIACEDGGSFTSSDSTTNSECFFSIYSAESEESQPLDNLFVDI